MDMSTSLGFNNSCGFTSSAQDAYKLAAQWMVGLRALLQDPQGFEANIKQMLAKAVCIRSFTFPISRLKFIC